MSIARSDSNKIDGTRGLVPKETADEVNACVASSVDEENAARGTTRCVILPADDSPGAVVKPAERPFPCSSP